MKASRKELFYERISNDWERMINNVETQKRLRVIFEELLAGVPLKGKRFLDVGCGLGYFSQRAANLGAKVIGVDIGKKLIEKAKQRVPKGKFFIASASDLPFKNESFDIVLCTEVIEHVDNQRKVLSEIFRVLKKGGVFAITTPNRIYRPIFEFLGLVGIRPYNGNEKWIFPWKLKGVLKTKGSIVKEKYFNFIYPTNFLDFFERFIFLKYFMINQGYLVKKIRDK